MIQLDAIIQSVPANQIVSTHAEILEVSLAKADPNFDSFEKEFEITIQSKTTINAFVGWFEVEMIDDLWLSTSPFQPQTHWQQTVFPVMEGEIFSEGELF